MASEGNAFTSVSIARSAGSHHLETLGGVRIGAMCISENPLPRTRVNKGKEKDRSVAAPALAMFYVLVLRGILVVVAIVPVIVIPVVRFVAIVVPDVSVLAVGAVRGVLALGRRRLVALLVGACRAYARLAAGRQRHPDDGDHCQHPEHPGLLHVLVLSWKVTHL